MSTGVFKKNIKSSRLYHRIFALITTKFNQYFSNQEYLRVLRNYIIKKRVISFLTAIMVSFIIRRNRSHENMSDHLLKIMKLYIYDNQEAHVLPARKLILMNKKTEKDCKKSIEKSSDIEQKENKKQSREEKIKDITFETKSKDSFGCNCCKGNDRKENYDFYNSDKTNKTNNENVYKNEEKNYMNVNIEINTENRVETEKTHFYTSKHPVIIIPGAGSTTLELWDSTDPDFDFRKNVWGSLGMIINSFINRDSWINSLLLDPVTGCDPPHSKVRAATGFSSSDYFIPGYWLWQKIFHNLGILGYDQTNLHVSSYDWRLSPDNLHKRDKYFDRLKMEIEMYYRLNSGIKIVMLCHSFGSLLFFYFMNWVESFEPGFVDKYIESWVCLSAPFLGAPKTIGLILSGESLATNTFFEGAFQEFFIKKSEKRKLFNSWGASYNLLPKGGKAVWGDRFIARIDGKDYNVNQINDMILRQNIHVEKCNEFNEFDDKFKKTLRKMKFSDKKRRILFYRFIDYHKHQIIRIMKNYGDVLLTKEYMCRNSSQYKFIDEICKDLVRKRVKFNDWLNPLKFSLPKAPKMKIYSIYGIGKRTERAFHYKKHINTENKNNSNVEFVIDKGYNDNENNTQNGIETCDGDGTVPFFSSGYMTYKGWKKNKKLNPSGIKTYTREYDDKTDIKQILNRGGPENSEHVDILGNFFVIEDILRIVSGEELDDKISSDIAKLSEDISKCLNSTSKKSEKS